MHVQSCRPEQISGPELDAPFEMSLMMMSSFSTPQRTMTIKCPLIRQHYQVIRLIVRCVENSFHRRSYISMQNSVGLQRKASLTRKCQSQAPLTGPDQGRAGMQKIYCEEIMFTTRAGCSLSDLLDNLKGKIDNSKMGRSTSEGPETVGEAETGLPQNTIIISFIGENSIDQGALRKEFLTEMDGQLSQDFLKGTNGGKTQSTMCQHIRTARSGTVETFLLLVWCRGGRHHMF
ncbi:hypothetical protein CgunFtcFv8_003409 [Champsocephalus gunnari]|uniref:Uncharacterized protein n=1 Tax=Champsocephalus gunnari TaxID=52237 RepID=A0AAN8HK39_CHAGU|nr:hypothetical protein CgunFtcFv8_003409 [Champsocephalus gunnari]